MYKQTINRREKWCSAYKLQSNCAKCWNYL